MVACAALIMIAMHPEVEVSISKTDDFLNGPRDTLRMLASYLVTDYFEQV